jgi:hypothetical protein
MVGSVAQVLFNVMQNFRPEVPPDEELPGHPTIETLAKFKELMTACWAEEPETRPTFEAVVSSLDEMRAIEADIRRAKGMEKR